jgi:hypothetical protein
LRDVHEEIERRGARVVVVGNGQPHHAAAFAKEEDVPFRLLVDPKLEAYRAAGLKRGLRHLVSWKSPTYLWRALKEGHRQTRTRGDAWQSGGIFIVTPESELRYRYVADEPGDHPPLTEVVAALG